MASGTARDTQLAAFESSSKIIKKLLQPFFGQVKEQATKINRGQTFPILLNFDIFLPDALACELNELEQRMEKSKR